MAQVSARPDDSDSGRPAPRTIPVWLPAAAALGGVYLIWGSTYFAIRVAIDTMPPLLMAGLRFLIAGLILYAVVELRAGPARAADRPTRRHWGSALIIGTALLGVGNGGVTLGEQRVATGIVSLLVATVPLWMALLGRVILKEKMSIGTGVGLVVGLGGVAVLLDPRGNASLLMMAAILLSPLGWAGGSLYSRSAPHPRRALMGPALEMIAGGGVLVVAGLVHGEAAHINASALSLASVLAFLYLIVFGSIVGYSCYVWLLHAIPTRIVATYAYVNPLVAVLLGFLFLNEHPGPRVLLAGALIVVAVALILSFPPRQRKAPDGR